MAIRPADTFADIPEVAGRRARWWAATKDFVRKRPLGAIGAAIVLLNIIVALGANVFAAYDPLATDYGAMLARPSMAHWLGTDAFGRDVLSRIIFGSRTAMIVGFACASFGATVGAVIGVASAYFGGKVDLLIQRVMDIFLSFPLIILALAVVSFLGLGVAEPTPAWGLMLRGAAVQFAEQAPWMAIFPGLAISLAVFAFNLFGDSLRDALDPRLRTQ